MRYSLRVCMCIAGSSHQSVSVGCFIIPPRCVTIAFVFFTFFAGLFVCVSAASAVVDCTSSVNCGMVCMDLDRLGDYCDSVVIRARAWMDQLAEMTENAVYAGLHEVRMTWQGKNVKRRCVFRKQCRLRRRQLVRKPRRLPKAVLVLVLKATIPKAFTERVRFRRHRFRRPWF